jgi:hypothetical protein
MTNTLAGPQSHATHIPGVRGPKPTAAKSMMQLFGRLKLTILGTLVVMLFVELEIHYHKTIISPRIQQQLV